MSLDEILQQVAERVAHKRAQGLYPPGLEEELEAEFEEVIRRQGVSSTQTLDDVKNLVVDYLAVIDHEEIVFVDRERPALVQLAWLSFQRRERNALDERIEFEAAFYTQDSLQLMARLMSEFPPAMQAMAGKERIEEPAAVLPFPHRQG